MHVTFKNGWCYELDTDNNLVTAIGRRCDCLPNYDIYGDGLVIFLTMQRYAPHDSNISGCDLTFLMDSAPAKTTDAYWDYANAVAKNGQASIQEQLHLLQILSQN